MANILIGALIGFLSAVSLRLWQYRRDFWLERIKEFCKAVDDVAQSGAEYWSKDASNPAPGVHDARILGLLVRIDGLYATLFPVERNDRLERVLSDFRDALSGGEFYGVSRKADADRARLIQMFASDLIVATWADAQQRISIQESWHQGCEYVSLWAGKIGEMGRKKL